MGPFNGLTEWVADIRPKNKAPNNGSKNRSSNWVPKEASQIGSLDWDLKIIPQNWPQNGSPTLGLYDRSSKIVLLNGPHNRPLR